MSDIVSSWSPARAVLPPDPDGHNRMLDRGAAEHLREVAPRLAPDASGYPFLSDERPPAPAPPAEATNPVKTLSALLVAGCAKLVTRLTAAQACDVVREIARQNGHDVVIEAPAPEATGEEPCACAGHREPGDPLICRKRYSEMLEAIYEDDYGDTAELRDALLRHDRALRARAREAEERAEKTTEHLLNSVARAVRRGDELESERDEAREQREDLANEILAERSDLAAANARAEEAERKALMAGQDKVAAQRRADSSHRLMENERAARLKAEKEMNLLIGRDVPRLEERLAAAEAEVATLKTVAFANQNAALDLAGKLEAAEAENAALRERAERLERAGDDMAALLPAYSELLARWAAAKGTK